MGDDRSLGCIMPGCPAKMARVDGTNSEAIERLREAVRRLAELNRDRVPTGVAHDDADEAFGTVNSDDAFGFDPFPLLRALHEAGARVVVIGQVAGILHGSAELTGDLDLLWDGEVDQAPLLAAAFAHMGASLSDDNGESVACSANAFMLPKVQFRTSNASGDCCTPALPWGDLQVYEFLDRCEVAVTDDGTVVRYVGRDDLIRMRKAVGRVKDLRRAEELQQGVSSRGAP